MLLVVDVLATPEALAKGCRIQNRRTATWHSCCPFPAAVCPIKMADRCCQVQPEDWGRVLKEKREVADGDK